MLITTNTYDTLFTVYCADFNDNYHRLSDEPSSELEREARKIRRRYKSLNEYTKAVRIYNEYVHLLANKYGGKRIFDIKVENDLVEEFMPPKPRMKNTTINRFILKHNIMLSETKSLKLNKNKIETYNNIFKSNELEVCESVNGNDKITKELAKEIKDKISAKELQKIDNIDFLEEYFKTKNISKLKDEEEFTPSLKEFMNGEYLDKIKDTSELDDVIYYQGNYINKGSLEELHTYQGLGDMGWNSLKIMKKKNISKRITNIVKDKKKKEKKKSKKRSDDDDFMTKLYSDNEYESFSDFEEDMLNFTAKNIFD